ncbi:MAG: hypothetical protein A2289_13010 [Deltaproteobacteria bacterium RIFOXYA12_FULL_58_15]|nr:MAG: hypothetical protein A2289_13010 [Deltaproteobacteria bacterium RIFOXYA12_FULL_58_15]OGR10149.1 MAG: hypothetical protein A2341_06155 [Deltaproteobacteria bacterium RIFOXYB12_FULL_58_9]
MRWILALSTLLICSGAHAAGLTDIAARVKPAVMQLSITNSSGEVVGNGTGFFISEDGLLVTNFHVIETAHGVIAQGPDEAVVEMLGVLAQDEEKDLAILQAKGAGHRILQLGDSVDLAEGTQVVVLGSPRGLLGSFSEGIVSAVRENGLPEKYRADSRQRGRLIQITAPIAPGSSGSPVLTLDGEVIGVAQSLVVGGGNLNFAVPVEAVKELAGTIALDAKPRPFQPFPWHNLVGSMIFFAVFATVLVVVQRVGRKGSPSETRSVN